MSNLNETHQKESWLFTHKFKNCLQLHIVHNIAWSSQLIIFRLNSRQLSQIRCCPLERRWSCCFNFVIWPYCECAHICHICFHCPSREMPKALCFRLFLLSVCACMRMFFSYLFFLVFLLVSYLSGFVQKTKLANIVRVHVNIYSYIRMHESRGGLRWPACHF